jgi:putative membrane protein
MNLATQIIAATFVVILVAVGVMEIFFHAARRLYPLTLIEPGDAAAVRMWAMNIGAYNIAFAAGIAAGLVLVQAGAVPAGTVLVLFGCSSHMLLGLWLWVTEKRLLASAIFQALVPGLAVVAYAFWH